MYELLVETAPGVWSPVDLGDNTPPMVFQINDLNQLNTRQASYSQALQLPKTVRNCEIFGFADVFETRSRIPYVVRRCALYCEGLTIAGTTFRLELRTVSDTFECQIVSNIRDLFATLGATAVENAPIFSRFKWSVESIAAANAGASPYVFAAAFAAKKEFALEPDSLVVENICYRAATRHANLAQVIFPYYDLRALVESILMAQGYSLETNLDRVPGYEKVFISLPDLVPDDDSFADLTKSASGPGVYYPGVLVPPINLSQYISSSTFMHGELQTGIIRGMYTGEISEFRTWQYNAPGVVNVSFALNTTGSGGKVRYRVLKINNIGWQGEEEVLSDTGEEGTPTAAEWISDEISLSAGERVYIEAVLLEAAAGQTYRATVSVSINSGDNKVCPGGIVNPGRSTGFKNQLDIIRLFVQTFGLLVDVDENRKVVRAYSFHEIVNRASAGKYVDWSDKIDEGSARRIDFKIGSYAQINRLLFTNNTLLDSQDPGIIPVNDANLAGEKDLFTLTAEASTNRQAWYASDEDFAANFAQSGVETSYRFQEKNPGVNDFTYTVGNNTYIKQTPAYIPMLEHVTGKTHLVTISDLPTQNNPVEYTLTGQQYNVLNKVTKAVSGQHIVDTYYAPLRDKILSPARVVEAYFALDPIDIANLDLLTPVYIEKYGDYFYIQKINNYITGRLTKCALVCLNLANN